MIHTDLNNLGVLIFICISFVTVIHIFDLKHSWWTWTVNTANKADLLTLEIRNMPFDLLQQLQPSRPEAFQLSELPPWASWSISIKAWWRLNAYAFNIADAFRRCTLSLNLVVRWCEPQSYILQLAFLKCLYKSSILPRLRTPRPPHCFHHAPLKVLSTVLAVLLAICLCVSHKFSFAWPEDLKHGLVCHNNLFHFIGQHCRSLTGAVY